MTTATPRRRRGDESGQTVTFTVTALAAIAVIGAIWIRFDLRLAIPLTAAAIITAIAAGEDAQTHRIRNIYTGMLAVAGLATAATYQALSWWPGLLSAILTSAAYAVVALIPAVVDDGIGGGDVKLIAALGTWLGWIAAGSIGAAVVGLLAIYLAMIAPLAVARVRRTRIPLGPAIAVGAAVALLIIGGTP